MKIMEEVVFDSIAAVDTTKMFAIFTKSATEFTAECECSLDETKSVAESLVTAQKRTLGGLFPSLQHQPCTG